MEQKYVMSEELAASELEKWEEEMEMETDTEDEETAASFRHCESTLKKALMKGLLTYEDGALVYEVSKHSPEGFRGEKIRIEMPTAMAYTGRKNPQDNMETIFGIVSNMTGKDLGWLKRLAIVDYKNLLSAATLFLLQ